MTTWRPRCGLALLSLSGAIAVAIGCRDTEGPVSPRHGAPRFAASAVTVIFEDGFENGLDTTLWEDERAKLGHSYRRYSIATNPVRSGTKSLQALYDTTDGGAWGILSRPFVGVDEVYVRFYVMFPDSFENRRPDGAGMHYFVLAGDSIDGGHSSFGKAGVRPNGADYFYAGLDPEHIQPDSAGPFAFYSYYPTMICGVPCFGVNFYQTLPIPIDLNEWQEVVFHVKLNTPGLANGSQSLWINGVQKIDVQNMVWRTAPTLRLNRVRFDNYMSKAPRVQYVWVDDVTVWRP